MSVSIEDLIQILIRYISVEERMSQQEVTNMLLKEALIARGLIVKEPK